MTRVLYIKDISGDTSFQDVRLTILDVGVDIFINENGNEIGRVSNKSIREHEKEKRDMEIATADLKIELQHDKEQAKEGEEITFTIIAKNSGKQNATNVYVENALPSGYLLIDSTHSVGNWKNGKWEIGNLAAGDQESLVIVARLLDTGIHAYQAKIYADQYDGNYTNNTMKIGNRVFVIKTRITSVESKAPMDGITSEEYGATVDFIIANNGDASAFEKNAIAYKNSVEIVGSESTRQAMVKIVNQDTGTGGTNITQPSNAQEHGGVIQADGSVIECTDRIGGHSIRLSSVTTRETVASFHSHPSGSTIEESGAVVGGADGPSFETKFNPGKGDISPNRAIETSYVFQRGELNGAGKVYIYNTHSGVQAIIPQANFVKLPKE